ncbi:MAG: exodeoxyribonuclease VII large subunit [Bacteroidales bacterium]|jgi:exodeoxyribonuclease VII large subunit|nr:exodeoxyribonuclease VII large subunit [Bacteroidales bacterium]
MNKASLRLSELTALVYQTINGTFGHEHYWVIGEISNHKNYGERHYFDFIEKKEQGSIIAKISAVAWDEVKEQILYFEKTTGQKFTSGIKVLLNVRVNYSPQYGLSLYVQGIDASYTLGELARQKQETLARLVYENDFITFQDGKYYTINKAFSLPAVIQKIAIVSSVHSAGIEDFKKVLKENNLGYRFDICEFHSSVQGENKGREIVNALIAIFKANEKERFDAVVILRGGGSETDFRIFDEYIVGLAVAKFPIPIFTGIGHTKDETIADLMAHTSTKTPTDTAKYIIEHNQIFESSVLDLRNSIVKKIKDIQHRNAMLLALAENMVTEKSKTFLQQHKSNSAFLSQTVVRHTKDLLYGHKTCLGEMRLGLQSQSKNKIANEKNQLSNIVLLYKKQPINFIKNKYSLLGHFVSVIRLVHPENILRKGFAIIEHNGKIAKNASDINIGDTVDIILSTDRLTSTVNKKQSVIKRKDIGI